MSGDHRSNLHFTMGFSVFLSIMGWLNSKKMRNKFLRVGFVLISLSISMLACTKEGFDGNATITGTVAHHGLAISDAIVYIKFGAKELPGTLESDFDASVVANTQGVYQFENLKAGDYYMYGVGFDTQIDTIVRGGIYVNLAKSEEKTVPLAVTED